MAMHVKSSRDSSGRVKKNIFSEINITPLTDIFLVLLIIMMVVAPMLDTSGLKLAVPSAGPSPDVQQQPKVTQLAIDASDRLTADNQPMALEGLRMYLRKHALEHPDGVVISTHPNASHNVLTQAMDAAQAAGIQKLAVTRQE